MKAKLAEFSKDHGLIIAGYSGADRSIMDTLHALLRNDDLLKSGIYWCVRKGSYISEELRKLLFKDRVYYVEVDGFDEMFAELYAKLNPGKFIPEGALGVNRRSGDTLQHLISSPSAIPLTNEVLRKARARLEKHTTRSALARLLARESEDDQSFFSGEKMTDDEFLMLSEISEMMMSERHDEAIERISNELDKNPSNTVRSKLIMQKITAFLAKQDYLQAKNAADEVIKIYPGRASSYISKSRICLSRDEQIACLNEAINADPYAVAPYISLCELKIEEAKNKYGEDRVRLLAEARDIAEKAVERDPSQRNMIWFEMLEIIDLEEVDVKNADERKRELINSLSLQNPFSGRILDLKRRSASKNKNNNLDYLEKIITDIKIAEKRYSDDNQSLSKIRLLVLFAMKDEVRLKVEISRIEDDIKRDPDLAALIAKIYREIFGDDEGALKVLKDSLRASQFDWEVLERLIECLCDLDLIEEAQEYFSKWNGRLGHKKRYEIKLYLLEKQKKFIECLQECIEYGRISGVSQSHHEAYFLLCTENFSGAESLLRKELSQVNYTPEASVEIVNLEFSKKMQGNKPDQGRLQKVLDISNNIETKVGVYAVLDKKDELISAIKEAIKDNKASRFIFKRWPVMKKHLSDEKINSLLMGDYQKISSEPARN